MLYSQHGFATCFYINNLNLQDDLVEATKLNEYLNHSINPGFSVALRLLKPANSTSPSCSWAFLKSGWSNPTSSRASRYCIINGSVQGQPNGASSPEIHPKWPPYGVTTKRQFGFAYPTREESVLKIITDTARLQTSCLNKQINKWRILNAMYWSRTSISARGIPRSGAIGSVKACKSNFNIQ